MAERKNLPERRAGYRQKVRIGGQKLFLGTGEYADGTLGELFLDVAKTGTALRSMMNAFAISVSIALQYGVPLQEYIDSFKNFRFEPSGTLEGDSRFESAGSILDYVFRELEASYILKDYPKEVAPEKPKLTIPEKVAGHVSRSEVG